MGQQLGEELSILNKRVRELRHKVSSEVYAYARDISMLWILGSLGTTVCGDNTAGKQSFGKYSLLKSNSYHESLFTVTSTFNIAGELSYGCCVATCCVNSFL